MYLYNLHITCIIIRHLTIIIIYYCFNHARVAGTYYMVAYYCRVFIIIIWCSNLMSAVARRVYQWIMCIYLSMVVLSRLFITIYYLDDCRDIIIILANVLVQRFWGSFFRFYQTLPSQPSRPPSPQPTRNSEYQLLLFFSLYIFSCQELHTR